MTRIRLSRQDHIAYVTLTRAEKKNAMDDAMIDALIAAAGEIAASDARAVILSGEGDCFCAGIDLAGLGALVGQDIEALILPRTHGEGTTNRWQEVAMVWHRLPCPVIAALHGEVYGAGLQLALGADLRIAAPDATLAVMEMKWGIVPDMGGMVLLPRLLRADVMKRLIYTAEPVPARQALAFGLVTEVADDPLAAARSLAEQIAGQSPKAIRAAKALCDLACRATPEEMLLAEARAQASLLGQAEQLEVVAARLGRRDPVFK
jgi:enoyl-CoA hydratase/carnithine racemase